MNLSRKPDRFLVAAAAMLCVAGAGLFAVAHVQADEQPNTYLEIYAAPRGAPDSAMRLYGRSNAIARLSLCYAFGAVALDTLSSLRPGTRFMASCGDGELRGLLGMRDLAAANAAQ